jgi:hypothetical protein
MQTTWRVNEEIAKLFLPGNGAESKHLLTIHGVGYKLVI